MSVKLISITTGIGDLAGKSAEDIISYCARVSNPNNQNNFETASKLLAYCIKQKHWSVFEQASMTVEVKTSRSISAQLTRHKSLNFQEYSSRYSKIEEYVKYPARRQDNKNRQNSIDDMSEIDKLWFEVAQEANWNNSYRLYKNALTRQISKEQARMLLPMNSATTLYMTGSIRSFITYLLVRLDKSTQKEHREIAEDIWTILKEQCPNIALALTKQHPEVFK